MLQLRTQLPQPLDTPRKPAARCLPNTHSFRPRPHSSLRSRHHRRDTCKGTRRTLKAHARRRRAGERITSDNIYYVAMPSGPSLLKTCAAVSSAAIPFPSPSRYEGFDWMRVPAAVYGRLCAFSLRCCGSGLAHRFSRSTVCFGSPTFRRQRPLYPPLGLTPQDWYMHARDAGGGHFGRLAPGGTASQQLRVAVSVFC